jgi:hypothetical protein
MIPKVAGVTLLPIRQNWSLQILQYKEYGSGFRP